MRGIAWALALWLAAAGCSGGGADNPPGAGKGALAGLEADIFVPLCARAGCHGGGQPAGELDLGAGKAHGSLVGVKASRRPERTRVVPGDPEGSYLVDRLVPGGDTPRMPLAAEPLSEAQLERIRSWVREGAPR